MSNQPTALETTEQSVDVLAVNLEDLLKRYDLYAQIKKKLLKPNDYYQVKTKDGKEVDAIRKSGWFKFGVAFQLSYEIIKEERIIDNSSEKPYIAFHFTVKAKAGSRSTDATGSCDNLEPKRLNATLHEIRAMAETRATERAIIKMMGTDDVAAEDYDNQENIPPGTPRACKCGLKFKPKAGAPGECSNCGGKKF